MKSVRLILLVALLLATASAFAQHAAKGKPQNDDPATAAADTQQAATDTKLRQPTKDEVQQLTSGLERSLSQPTDLAVVPLGNGIYKIDLDGTHEDVALAKIGPDGKAVVGCVASKQEAEAFLDPSAKRSLQAIAKAAVSAAIATTSKPAMEWEEK